MPNTIKLRISGAALLAALAAGIPLDGMATAGRIDFAVGDVRALAADGRSRPLARGGDVASGEMIDTGNGRAQLRFTDGAQVSLAPQTQFRIDDYRFAGQADGSEKGFFSLLKGAMRTITGVVGRRNRDNYRVSTIVATIGIRGTEFSVTYGNSISVTTGEGSNEVCNAAGCLILNSGETAFVADSNTRPVMTDKKTEIPPPPVQGRGLQLPEYVAGDNVTQDGTPAGLPSSPPAGLTSGAGYSITLSSVFSSISPPGAGQWSADGITGSTTAMFSGGGLAAFSDGPMEVFQGAPVGMLSDGIIGWGRWIDASRLLGGTPLDTLQHTHYVVGLPTPVMPTMGTANFTLIGYTFPTATLDGVNFTFGTQPITGSLAVDFGAGNVAGSLGVPIGGNTYSTSWPTGTITGTVFGGGGTAVTGGGCTGCWSYINGFFAGANASRAGLSYMFTGTPIGTIMGAAAFSQ